MPKVNLSRDAPKITVSDLHYMRQVEIANLERVNRLKKVRSNNRLMGSCLTAFALAIYGYTIYAVKQEKFLDDFDEPEKLSDGE